jgi:subtilisin family serine protease
MSLVRASLPFVASLVSCFLGTPARSAGPSCPSGLVNRPVGKLLATFQSAEPRELQHLIVGLPWESDPQSEEARVLQFDQIAKEFETTRVHHYAGLNAVLVRGAEPDLMRLKDWLSRCPDLVRYVELDYNAMLPLVPPLKPTTPLAVPPDSRNPNLPDQESFKRMHIPEAWDAGYFGSTDVLVAVIDSGMQLDHEDLRDNLWKGDANHPAHGVDLLDSTKPPDDKDGHGTQVAGVIGAVWDNGKCGRGVNRDVRLVALKALRASRGTLHSVVKAFQYAIEIRAQVINASWRIAPSRLLEDAVRVAGSYEIVVVAAAPTDESSSGRDVDAGAPDYPCGLPLDNVICVTATDGADGLAPLASYGARSVDLGATVTGIETLFRGNICAEGQPTSSMAAPHVTGVVALLRAECSTLSAREVRDRILATVDPAEALEGKTTSNGRLSAHAALVAPCDAEFHGPRPAADLR